jgi:hypothetical protein
MPSGAFLDVDAHRRRSLSLGALRGRSVDWVESRTELELAWELVTPSRDEGRKESRRDLGKVHGTSTWDVPSLSPPVSYRACAPAARNIHQGGAATFDGKDGPGVGSSKWERRVWEGRSEGRGGRGGEGCDRKSPLLAPPLLPSHPGPPSPQGAGTLNSLPQAPLVHTPLPPSTPTSAQASAHTRLSHLTSHLLTGTCLTSTLPWSGPFCPALRSRQTRGETGEE